MSTKTSSRAKSNGFSSTVVHLPLFRAPGIFTHKCDNPNNFIPTLLSFWPRYDFNSFNPVFIKTSFGTLVTMHPKVLANNPTLNVANNLVNHLIAQNNSIHAELLKSWENAPDPLPIKKTVDNVVTERIPNRPKQPLFIQPTVTDVYGPAFLFIRKKKCVRNVPKPICALVQREYQLHFSYILSGLSSADEPQKPITARHLFMKHFFEEKKLANQRDIENGGQPVKGPILSGEPSAAWKVMTPEQKKPYEDAANIARENYERARDAYYSQQPRIPKTPTKAHYLYSAGHPTGPTWGSLTDTEKQPYRNQEAQEQVAYQAELADLKVWCATRGQDFESLVHGFPTPALPVEKTRKRREPSQKAEKAEKAEPKEKKVRKPRAKKPTQEKEKEKAPRKRRKVVETD